MYLYTKDNGLRIHENYGNWKMLVIYTNIKVLGNNIYTIYCKNDRSIM